MLLTEKMDIAAAEEEREGRYFSLLAKQSLFAGLLRLQAATEGWALAQAVEAEAEAAVGELQHLRSLLLRLNQAKVPRQLTVAEECGMKETFYQKS